MRRGAATISDFPHRLAARRRAIDRLTRLLAAFGGFAVIGSVLLLFAYLTSVVLPLFESAKVLPLKTQQLEPRQTLLLHFEAYRDGLLRFSERQVDWIPEPGAAAEPLHEFSAPLLRAQTLSARSEYFAVQLDSNALRLLELRTNPAGQLALRPAFAGDTIPLLRADAATDLSVHDGVLVMAQLDGRRLELKRYRGLDPRLGLGVAETVYLELSEAFDQVAIGARQRSVWLLSREGRAAFYDLGQFATPVRRASASLWSPPVTLEDHAFLSGRSSLLLARSDGLIEKRQLSLSGGQAQFALMRTLEGASSGALLLPERRRKSFVTLDSDGQLRLGHGTDGRWLASAAVDPVADTVSQAQAGGRRVQGALSGSGARLAVEQASGLLQWFEIRNPYPEVSLKLLWSRIWYEGYDRPQHSWQSSAADDEFEPKLSLTPLLFGTFKAALVAMAFAAPVAVMGALYTACFMAPRQRALIKPMVELMAAVPTVVLGFVAGLWLAPLVERNLSSVLGLLVALPIGVFGCALLLQRLPARWGRRLQGSYALLTVVPILSIGALGFLLGPTLEVELFGGNSAAWLQRSFGLEFDQRNALVVGIAMGFAVIPPIFSLAEDALHGVPSHLRDGALALGATPWQSALQVVLLTASPGIFAALVIGIGRAFGETMIVLMATGNTPILDWNLFEGMRTMAANIAVELPEAEVGSAHYRVLFLMALLLFGFTFIFNTVAEVVRARLRRRYGRL